MRHRKIPRWISEAFEGLSIDDVIKALALWKYSYSTDATNPTARCSWCNQRSLMAKCTACRRAETQQWRAIIEASGKVKAVIPPISDIDERLRRVEAALFIGQDGVARAEDGPYAPHAIMEALRVATGEEEPTEAPSGS